MTISYLNINKKDCFNKIYIYDGWSDNREILFESSLNADVTTVLDNIKKLKISDNSYVLQSNESKYILEIVKCNNEHKSYYIWENNMIMDSDNVVYIFEYNQDFENFINYINKKTRK
jgi:hypothetical protein